METGSVGIENKILCFHPTDPSVNERYTHSLGFCFVLRIYLGSGHYTTGTKGGEPRHRIEVVQTEVERCWEGKGGTPDHLGTHSSDKFM